MRNLRCFAILPLALSSLAMTPLRAGASDDITSPTSPVRLIFIHHSTGENWLSDDNGGLGIALRDNNYYVSDTNYGWGPDSIGDATDIGNWWTWFRGPNGSIYRSALYAEGDQHCGYSRLAMAPPGDNQIIMFKSCFPNSDLRGSTSDSIPLIDSNPLRGESSGSDYHTVANAKGIYIDLLNYFATRRDKLFIVVCAPPRTASTYAANARAFNEWLVKDWLSGYPYANVFVFGFYNVLTTNGGDANTNDLGAASGNHHRWWSGAIQYKSDTANSNTEAYPSGDDHPSQAGNLKATGEFLSLLNVAYNRWINSPRPTPSPEPTPSQHPSPTASPTARPTPSPCPSPTEFPTPTASCGPRVDSVTRLDGNPTAASTVRFEITFNDFMINVKNSDFAISTTGAFTTAPAVLSVTSSGLGNIYTALVDSGVGVGEIRLDVRADATIINPTSQTLVNLPYTQGEVYTILRPSAAMIGDYLLLGGDSDGMDANQDGVVDVADMLWALRNGR
ncbi:MAG: hypothetical protein NTX50_26570 [Candidatus Sumerlaeota bacterium]|nr:hypothetical protein [Candidatus Sumerlaeota bacterium]